jgi:HTH-type transcriptional regulator / antitoxin HigA
MGADERSYLRGGTDMRHPKKVQKLQNAADYGTALRTIRPYFENEPEAGSAIEAHFDALARVIEDYEARHYPISPSGPTPNDAEK